MADSEEPFIFNSRINESDDQNHQHEDFLPQKFNGYSKKTPESTHFTVMGNSEPQKSNVIRTSKYTCLSFFPLNFWYQITKAANIYFIVICGLQCVPQVSISGGQPTNAPPLLFVIFVSMIKDFFEDRTRQQSDAEENNNTTEVLQNDGVWRGTMWRNVKVGDVLKVNENEAFAADLVILKTSADNVCYVETKNLDGETNLKHKAAPLDTVNLPEHEYKAMTVECEPPSDKIYQFQGVLTTTSTKKIPLTYENFALRGCNLRNTQFVVGIVTYIGSDTRIMRNSTQSRPKKSNLEQQTSVQIVLVFCTMMVCCACAATYVMLWNMSYRDSTNTYLAFYDQTLAPPEWNLGQDVKIWVFNFCTWILLFTNMVPISLLVTLEIVKFFQARSICWDVSIYSIEKDMPTKVQSSNLNEELGQIQYVFSDKTGTLTCNVMDFRKLSAGSISYGSSNRVEKSVLEKFQKCAGPLVANVNLDVSNLLADLKPGSKNFDKVDAMMLNLALNHSVLIGSRGYCASSPDELALVNAAKYCGYEFINRENKDNSVTIKVQGQKQIWFLLQVIDFTSARKRMTSLFRSPLGEIFVFSKGADSILLPLCGKGQDKLKKQSSDYMDGYAKEGLRTLLLAQKKLSSAEYEVWNKQYKLASLSVSDRDSLLDKCSAKLEVDFSISGSTAIEDRLQEGVPEAIIHIRRAGIKLWVLTGDKIETAINVGYSSGLLDDETNQYIIDADSSIDIYKQMCIAQNNCSLYKGKKENAIIVAGDSLLKITAKSTLTEKFLTLIDQANVVLACRVSPKQKAEIVMMIRQAHPTAKTLAIGDGANDVNMITAAHVGIGISGLEGQQAARASDYAIGQFNFLIPLLFNHGREAYRRNSYLVIYMFYKNVIFVAAQFWFGFRNAFSGQTLYEPFLYQGYNLVFTAFPIIWFAVFDLQHDKARFLKDPSLYEIGLKNECFDTATFFQSILNALVNGFAIWMFCFYGEGGTIVNSEGLNGDFWYDGTMVYAAVVLVVNLQILQRTSTHSWMSVLIFVLSVGSFWAWFWLESYFSIFPQFYKIFVEFCTREQTWTVLALCSWFNLGQFIFYHNWWTWRKIENKFAAEILGEQDRLKHKEDLTLRMKEMASDEFKVVQTKDSHDMGEKTPILGDRRSTNLGYAFSQEDDFQTAVQRVYKSNRRNSTAPFQQQ